MVLLGLVVLLGTVPVVPAGAAVGPTAAGSAAAGSAVAGPTVAGPTVAGPTVAGPAPSPVTRCVLDDPRLAEASGLAWSPEGLWTVNDSGNPSTAYRLRPDCSVAGTRAVAVDGRDVEDLARDADDTLWLADTGDNARTRASVAVLRLPPTGGEVVTRLAYPDGPHDVEALLLPADGRPVLVTKDLGGRSGVYAPDAPLPPTSVAPSPDPVPLRRVGDVVLPPSSTPTPGRGALGLLGGGQVTGGAVSPDGRVAVLRTYTDAWLFPTGSAAGGPVTADVVVDALRATPAMVPLPGEPQGEAVAVTPDGGLLSASESPAGDETGQLREVPGALAAMAAGLVAPVGPTGPAGGEASGPTLVSDGAGGPSRAVTAVAAVALLAGGLGVAWWRRARRPGRGR